MSKINQMNSMIQAIKPFKEISETGKKENNISSNNFLGELNAAQKEEGEKIIGVIKGEVEDLNEAMIAVEKAGLSFQIMLEFRNKLLETYHEVMRMRF